jgi:hypothetical protein
MRFRTGQKLKFALFFIRLSYRDHDFSPILHGVCSRGAQRVRAHQCQYGICPFAQAQGRYNLLLRDCRRPSAVDPVPQVAFVERRVVDTMTPIASFAIGVSKGKLVRAEVNQRPINIARQYAWMIATLLSDFIQE